MGIHRGGPKEPPPTTWDKIKALGIIVALIAVVSTTLGLGMASIEERYCAGEFDTPQCKVDRAEARARAYERHRESN